MGTYELKEPPVSVALAAPSAGVATTVAREDSLHPLPHVADTRDALAMMRRELDAYWHSMRGFMSMEPDQVLIALSGYTARVGEMRKNCWRDGGRLANKLRTEEIDPFLDQCEFQYKIHSRLQSIRQMDWEMTRGAPT